MSLFSIKRLEQDKDIEQWKRLCLKADGATLFHEYDFLSYHGDKFNEHHLGVFKGTTLFGIIPLAIDESGIARSPYGASYGGFIFTEILSYSDSKIIVDQFLDYLKAIHVKKVLITPPIDVYYDNYSATFLFSLLAQGFKFTNSDITSVARLYENIEESLFSSRTRRSIKKAKSNNITINYNGNTDDFWKIMDKTFYRHNTSPTHSKEQWEYLCLKFPDKIFSPIAYLENTPVSAIGYFQVSKKCGMSFYIANDSEYKETQALTYLIAEFLQWLIKNKKADKFDFGTSSVNMIARENIFEFKENFGANGVFKHTISKELN
jgi:hypothetical protein